MQKITLNLLVLLLFVFTLSSCSTVNPMLSYVQASVKTTAHKAKNKSKQLKKDPHLKHFHTPNLLKLDITKIKPQAQAPTLSFLTTKALPFHYTALNPHTFASTHQQTYLREDLVCYAKNYLGIPYRSGGKSAKGFDCSGFTSFVMSNFGYNVPSASVRQAEIGETIPLASAKKGDLIFFGNKGKKGTYRVTHAAMVVSEAGEDLAMIHASRRGIVIDDIHSSSWKKYYAKRFLHVKRVLDSKELVKQAQ
jgi:cell wall-associated NlpC family hydrolase